MIPTSTSNSTTKGTINTDRSDRRFLRSPEFREAIDLIFTLKPHKTADRTRIKADGQDLSYITVELHDAEGVRHPKADNLVMFEIEGPGTIAGVGNADPKSTESYQQHKRKAWQGRCLVIVKAEKEAGDIVLTASATGLQPARIVITAEQ